MITNYNSMHRKIARVRGSAKGYLCVDCGEKNAHHWSLRAGADYIIQVGTTTAGRLFSTDVNDYEPRCVPCHAKHDIGNGLVQSPYGVRKNPPKRGTCKIAGCSGENKAKGLCTKHYDQLRNDLAREKKLSEPVLDLRTPEQKATAEIMKHLHDVVAEHDLDLMKIVGMVSYQTKKMMKEAKEND